MSIVERIKKGRIVPVIRKASVDNILPIAGSLLKGGISTIEITAESKQADEMIQLVKEEYGEKVLVGAGTVLDGETARQMLLAGAEFIVAPSLNVETIKMANRYGAPCIPGVFTPTEIVTAFENGASMVKVFPASVLGPEYIKNIKGPLPHIPVMVTGGIHLDNMNTYFDNGAEVAGIGSQLVKPENYKEESDYDRLAELAETYMKKISQAL
ncbi:bifunctional 4-hydroxy-2-oxoglutarate aldolase/2-dehydro-3-deoxy-phosphogluconate aldolase [Halobacillus salinarum]|uniref:Bifunctional 4-hydroxy-2-oxoglutarate aldolase/2-dehydro-3-deoxy-phosphogluconate aldolase n=1 Tax=Halobacillus salinarum TaxID=2932257 RepID=A0ABY4ELV6_9BACI|nr:bifunctional 4-hydroxy-2-oxoglutarate aldolase/2-dehydro-3-deoxy-phosphogluconate aldolase [Halobacillus salinarum]UOQ45154.1 bifunctional 4-hydroxy-2-oxoglutarate aldolase/2-dehydro-3-deoxy-phosphogluconate aldolase [Halobacillus salinarum]